MMCRNIHRRHWPHELAKYMQRRKTKGRRSAPRLSHLHAHDAEETLPKNIGELGMIEKSRAKIIADEIMAECHLYEPLDFRLAFIAMTKATGEFLAHVEASLPDARHLYMTALKTKLRAARDMSRAIPNRKT